MDFSLNQDQLELKARMRRFARDVIRPAAPQHDADESTPWEVMRAAREQGLHGLENLQQMGSDPDGMYGVIGAEELHWGCAGIALAISGSGLAAAGLAASGTPEQIARWEPECFGVGDEIKLGQPRQHLLAPFSDVRGLRHERNENMRRGRESKLFVGFLCRPAHPAVVIPVFAARERPGPTSAVAL